MIAGACRDPCLSISAAPSGACDAIMDFPSPCVGNGGLGSQLSDAQKMSPMLKEKQNNLIHHFSAEDHGRCPPCQWWGHAWLLSPVPPIQVSPLASQPPGAWPRGALPPASDKIQPRGLATAPRGAALGSWLACSQHHLPHYGSACLPGGKRTGGALSTAAVTVALRPHMWWLLGMVASPTLSWTMPRAAPVLNRWLHSGARSQLPGECGPPTLTCHKPPNRILNEKCTEMGVSTSG